MIIRRWRKTLTISLAVIAAGCSQPAIAEQQPGNSGSAVAGSFDAAAAQREIAAIMQRQRIPGVQVVAVARDGLIWRNALGLADVERKRPMTAGTLIQAGSVTKVFTASLIADLIAKDELAWTDTLSKLFPGIAMRPEVGRISIADLASHTSRLPKDPPNRVDVDGVWRPYTRAELYAALADPRLELVKPDWNYRTSASPSSAISWRRSPESPSSRCFRSASSSPCRCVRRSSP